MMAIYFGFILLVAFAKPFLGRLLMPGLSLGTLLGALVIVSAWVLIWVYVRWANGHYDETVANAQAAAVSPSLGAPNMVAILFFFLFVAVTLAITFWAARRTRSTEQFYAAGRSVTGLQNGLTLAGD